MQKNGAGLHTASSCYWDNATDGQFLLTTAQQGMLKMQLLVSFPSASLWLQKSTGFTVLCYRFRPDLMSGRACGSSMVHSHRSGILKKSANEN